MDYQRLYEYRFRDVDQSARTAVWQPIANFMYEQMGRPERVLDPAAGRGEFINAVPASERWAVDMVAYAEGTYAPGVKSVVSDIFDAELPEDHFGGIFISNFLEHLLSQEATAEFLTKMRRVTAPGGRIVVMGPNFRYCAKQYFDMADHTLVYTHRAIAEHLYAAGYEVERVVPQFLPYSFTGRLPPSVTLLEQYLKMPFAWRLLGKQFLVIGRRAS
jgi:ubiquinone/menaquinone biosynthesis C-methylase UbiE